MAGTLRELVYKEYQKYIDQADVDPELKRALRTHERIPVSINNLVAQLQGISNRISKEKIISAVHDVARWTLQLIAIKATQQRMSIAEKNRLRDEAVKADQFRKDVETYDEKGAMHVIKTSESFEKERSQIGLRSRDYDEGIAIESAQKSVQTPAASPEV